MGKKRPSGRPGFLFKSLIILLAIGFTIEFISKIPKWLPIILVTFIVVLAVVKISNRKTGFAQKELCEIDDMSGYDFEQYVAYLLQCCGYSNVEVTQKSGDWGADVIAYKNEDKIAFQCKRSESNIGNKAVQEVLGGMGYYNCTKGIVVTNANFTNAAVEQAARCNIELWGRDELAQIINTAN